MAIRDDFEVVAGQVRVVLQRFALGLLVLAAFIAMLVGKADTVLVENARVLALAAERLTPEPAAPSSAEMEALQELVHARQAAMAERTAFFEPALDVTSTPSERIDEAHDFGATLPGSDFSHSDAGLDVDRLAVGDAARPRLGVVASFGGVRRLARRHGGESEV